MLYYSRKYYKPLDKYSKKLLCSHCFGKMIVTELLIGKVSGCMTSNTFKSFQLLDPIVFGSICIF